MDVLHTIVVPVFTGISSALIANAPSILLHSTPLFGLLFGAWWLKRLFLSVAYDDGVKRTGADYFDPRNAAKRRDEGVFTQDEFEEKDKDDGDYHGSGFEEDREERWYSI